MAMTRRGLHSMSDNTGRARGTVHAIKGDFFLFVRSTVSSSILLRDLYPIYAAYIGGKGLRSYVPRAAATQKSVVWTFS